MKSKVQYIGKSVFYEKNPVNSYFINISDMETYLLCIKNNFCVFSFALWVIESGSSGVLYFKAKLLTLEILRKK